MSRAFGGLGGVSKARYIVARVGQAGFRWTAWLPESLFRTGGTLTATGDTKNLSAARRAGKAAARELEIAWAEAKKRAGER